MCGCASLEWAFGNYHATISALSTSSPGWGISGWSWLSALDGGAEGQEGPNLRFGEFVGVAE